MARRILGFVGGEGLWEANSGVYLGGHSPYAYGPPFIIGVSAPWGVVCLGVAVVLVCVGGLCWCCVGVVSVLCRCCVSPEIPWGSRGTAAWKQVLITVLV